jgi:hypothetical protein
MRNAESQNRQEFRPAIPCRTPLPAAAGSTRHATQRKKCFPFASDLLRIAPMSILNHWMIRATGCAVLCATLPQLQAQEQSQDGVSTLSNGIPSLTDTVSVTPVATEPMPVEAPPEVIQSPTAIPVAESPPLAPPVLYPVADGTAADATEPWSDVDDVFEDLPEGGQSSADIEAAATEAGLDGTGDLFQSLPTGYESPGGGYTPLPSKLKGWTLGISARLTYDSNAKQSPGWPVAPVQDDWIFSLTPSIGYRTVGGEWYTSINASLGWNHYFQTDPSDGYNIGMNLQVGYEGPKLDASLNLSYSFQEGYNRYFNGGGRNNNFVSQHNVDLGLSASYRLSSKTSMTGRLSTNALAPTGNQYNNTQSFRGDLGMKWKATGLTDLEGGVSYSQQSGDRQFDRSTIGPYIGVNYRLAAKVALDARVGLDVVSFDGPGSSSDMFVPFNLGLTYNASSLWGLNLSVYRDVNADQSTSASYRERLGARLGYHRRIRRAMLNLGASYETNSYNGIANRRGDDGTYYSLDTSLSMPVFSDRASASIFVRYSDEDTDNINRSWDGYQIGASIGASF